MKFSDNSLVVRCLLESFRAANECCRASKTMFESFMKILTNFRVTSALSGDMGLETDPDLEETEAGMVGWVWREISSSYVNIGLTVAILYLLYKILFAKEEEDPVVAVEPPLPPVKKQVRR